MAPNCLWASFLQPHTPFRSHRDYFAEYRAEELTLPPRPAGDLENELPGHLVRARERGWAQQSEGEARRSLAGDCHGSKPCGRRHRRRKDCAQSTCGDG